MAKHINATTKKIPCISLYLNKAMPCVIYTDKDVSQHCYLSISMITRCVFTSSWAASMDSLQTLFTTAMYWSFFNTTSGIKISQTCSNNFSMWRVRNCSNILSLPGNIVNKTGNWCSSVHQCTCAACIFYKQQNRSTCVKSFFTL